MIETENEWRIIHFEMDVGHGLMSSSPLGNSVNRADPSNNVDKEVPFHTQTINNEFQISKFQLS